MGIENSLTTSTYHILTPYPGTKLYERLSKENRILTNDWDLYDTRHAVYEPKLLTVDELETGYKWAYKEFYKWSNIIESSFMHDSLKHKIKHLIYTGGWKKFEGLWNLAINIGGLKGMLPILELLLSKVDYDKKGSKNNEN